MDKKSIIGIVLMIALFVGFSFYQSHEIEEQQKIVREKAKVEQAERAQQLAEAEAERMLEEQMTAEERLERDSIAELERTNAEVARHGATLYAARRGVVKQEVVSNDFMSVTFDNRGGKIVDVTLNNHYRYAEGERTELVKLMTPESMKMGISLRRAGANELLNTNNYFFVPSVKKLEDRTIVTMTLDIERDAWVEYIYTIYNTGNASRDYLVDFCIKQHNIDQMLSNGDEIVLTWHNKSNKNERSFKNESMATTIEYFVDGDVEELDADGEPETEEGVEWVAFKQQYFSSALISEHPFTATMSFKSAKNEKAGYMKEFDAKVAIPHTSGRELYNLAFYYGPNDYKVMKSVEFMGHSCDLEKIIPMGGTLIGWWNKIVTIPVFHWLRGHGLSFGLIILILTLLVKAVILPLTYKSYMSTAKMRAIRPELEAINQKYPKQEDAMKKQQATMELYQKVGISPMGGCLPLLIQMPILWAMFRFIPASIELRGQSFLWADDLSTYDSVLELPFNIPFYGDHVNLFALLMTLALFGYSFFSYKQQEATTAGQPGAGMMKFMMVYFMPLMMLCVMNEFSSGLCYYYFLSQILTMIIMFVIRHSVNDEQVRAKLMAKKPKKKSKFQERYEEALRQQQDQMTINREMRRHQNR
ncbi:MAG: membrane protein insertase YidC [Alistipes sp.]|nr:membrane protein insertase YidC [Alistipes sp.]